MMLSNQTSRYICQYIEIIITLHDLTTSSRTQVKSAYQQINFIISQPKHMFKLMGKKISRI